MSERFELLLDGYVGMRLDKALAAVHPDFSRAQWQKLIREERVLLNGRKTKASLKLEGGEVVSAEIPAVVETDIVPEDIPLDVRYEDNDLIVVNKPSGMVTHPSVGNESGTLVNAILHYCPGLAGVGGEKRPGIIHRLDKNTSGLLVVAKNDKALRFMQAQFQERTVHKAYLALVNGHIEPEQALIDAPIGRDPKHRKKMVVIPPSSSHFAREAQTSYELLTRYDDYSLVRCTLHTGRTHQIRVHLSYIGYPIVGDKIYGRRKQLLLKHRHFLHAAELGFVRPSDGEKVSLSAELPPKLQAVVDQLG